MYIGALDTNERRWHLTSLCANVRIDNDRLSTRLWNTYVVPTHRKLRVYRVAIFVISFKWRCSIWYTVLREKGLPTTYVLK